MTVGIAQDRYHSFFLGSATAGIILAGAHRHILEANRKAEELFGVLSQQLEGSVFSSHFLSPADVERCLDLCAKNKEARAEAELIGADGCPVPVEIHASHVRFGRASFVHVALNNIVEKRRLEDKLHAYAKLIDASSQAQARFLSEMPTQTIFSDLLETVLELTQSEFGLIAETLYTEDGSPYFKIKVVSRSFWNKISREFYVKNAPIGMEFYNLNSILGSVIRTGKPVISNIPAIDPRRTKMPEGHPPIDSFIGLPFLNGTQTVGMICLANRKGGYDEETGDFLKPILETCGSLLSAYHTNQWRKEAEVELRRQALVFENISDSVILTDQTGRIVDCNPMAEKKFGFSKFDMLGAPIDFISNADSDRPLLPTLRRSLSKRGRWSGELKSLDKQGVERLFETVVVPLRDLREDEGTLIWLSRDITDTKAAQQRLDQRSREMDAIFSLSPDGFVFIDRQRKISYVNPAFESMTGLKARKLIGQEAGKLDQSLAKMQDPCNVCVTDCAEVDGAECLIHLSRPRLTILKCITRHLRDHNGGLLGIVRYFRDITYESEVDRMKSEFLSTAAHELRTPMASVFGFSELLLKREFPPEKNREIVDIIHRQSGHLVSLLNELLDLARIESRAGKDFNIATQDILPIIRNTLAELLIPGDSRQVTANLPDLLPHVAVDAEKMQLTLTNVLSNAYKYSLGMGPIELSVQTRKQGGRPWLGIQVRDHGIGMSMEQVKRIFERFYRADASGKIPGTGLGMSLVKEIMDIFAGEVEIKSAPGQGTEVTLWLPIEKEAS